MMLFYFMIIEWTYEDHQNPSWDSGVLRKVSSSSRRLLAQDFQRTKLQKCISLEHSLLNYQKVLPMASRRYRFARDLNISSSYTRTTFRRTEELVAYWSFSALTISPPYIWHAVKILFFRATYILSMFCNLLRLYVSVIPCNVCTRLHGLMSGPVIFYTR